MFLAAFGPIGFAILARLNDKASGEPNRYAQVVRKMNKIVRAGYEACCFVIIWLVAFQAMVVMRYLIILWQSATTGMSIAQIVDLQNASSGMWAFSEGMEVMYMVVLPYLIWPIVFNIVGGVVTTLAPSKAAEFGLCHRRRRAVRATPVG